MTERGVGVIARRRRRLYALGAVPMAVIVTLSGCNADGQSTQPSDGDSTTTTSAQPNVYLEQRAQGVSALLASLSRVLTQGSPRQLDELVDQSASAAFRASLHTIQNNLSPAADSAATQAARRGRGARVQVNTLRYQLAPTEEAETLVSAEVQERLDRQGSSDTWVAPVEVHSALGGASLPGVAEDDIVISTQLVAARYDDTWRLVGDATVVNEPAPPTQLWNLAGLAGTDVGSAGGSSLIASYPGTTEALIARIRTLLPGAVDAVTAVWTPPWPRRAVVVATGTVGQSVALAGPDTDAASAAAATVYAQVDATRHRATGQRIILTPEAAALPAPALGVVLRHELTHVATRAYTATTAPMWLTEGFAEYVGRKGTYTRPADAAPNLARAVAAGDVPDDLPADARFALGADETMMAYQSAWSVLAFVADRFGQAALTTLYRGVAASGDVRGQDAALRSALGIDRARFVAEWRDWLSKEMR